MKKNKLNSLMDLVDERFIDESSPENACKYNFSVKKTQTRYYLTAACILLFIIASLVCIALFTQESPLPPNDDGVIPPANNVPVEDSIIYSERVDGDSLYFVEGSSAKIDQGVSSSPPAFDFSFGSITVKAKALYVLEDTYVKLSSNMTFAPKKYKVVRFSTLEAINIDNFPAEFFYLLPEKLNNGLTDYDCLVIAMQTISFGNYVMKNIDDGLIEALTLPVFSDPSDHPELGNMIAFNDGKFDETLWQNESWYYGYQFGKRILDDTDSDDYFVKRGSSLERCIKTIKANRKKSSFVFPELKTDEAKAAYEYTKPFENGVFGQNMFYGLNGYILVYTRYIDGCFTEEEIRIDTGTGEVTYFGEKYTQEEYGNLFRITEKMKELAEEYAVNKPLPIHFSEEGKKRLSLSLFGWYPKIEGKVYGLIKTVWIYQEEDDYYKQYYDDSYLLYNPDEEKWNPIDRNDLLEVLGKEYLEWGLYEGLVYLDDYTKEINVPM